MDLTFKPSSPRTIGMELELQLLDPETQDLIDRVMPVIEYFPDSPFIKSEFVQNTIEIASKVCTSLPELEANVSELSAQLKAKCETLGIALCGGGTHPFSEKLALITPLPRYQRMTKTMGLLSHIQITYSTHVHIGMPSGDEAISVMHHLKPYLPVLIAMSANSPFWRGYDTGYASYRHRILAASRSYGIPPTFADWNAFYEFFQSTTHAGLFKTINDIHWDIRPRPHLGTIEIRVMDAQSTVRDSVILAGFVRALVYFIRQEKDKPNHGRLLKESHWWIEKDNHFQASHLGLSANYIGAECGSLRSIRDVINETLDAVSESVAEEADAVSNIERLRSNILKIPGYQYQYSCYETLGSLKDLVAKLVEKFNRGQTTVYKQRVGGC
jgi:carboxylate-amine ligase